MQCNDYCVDDDINLFQRAGERDEMSSTNKFTSHCNYQPRVNRDVSHSFVAATSFSNPPTDDSFVSDRIQGKTSNETPA